MGTAGNATHREPWNKGKIVGQKAPFELKDIWALRVRLQMEGRVRELALFNLGIDSKLRGCDLVALKVRDVCHGDQVAARAIVMQLKTQRPVQFEITAATRDAVQAWIKQAGLKPEDFLFPSRLHDSPHLGDRQYARILGHWVDELPAGPHRLRDALGAKDQGDADLSAHQEPARRATSPRALQARVDSEIPRHRGR
jgi:integrase